jgi:hypothetical protein
VQRLDAWEAQTVHEEVQALSGLHEQAEQFPRRAIPVLDECAKARAARIAVAEVQKHHATWTMAQLRFEVHRALPVMTPTADAEALITEVARLAISGRAGAEVVQVTAPDITDVSSLGIRQSDGGSIYRPPHEERWTTLPHLDVEEKILADAQTAVPRLVSEAAAGAAAERTTLNPEQHTPEHVSELENETEASDSFRREPISGQLEPEPYEEPATDVGQPGNRAARLDELQARADKAAHRIAADEAEQQASAEYVARIERQAQAEPQADWSAERGEAEIEL